MATSHETSILVKTVAVLMEVTLNRPPVINTLNWEMIRLLRRAFDEALADDQVRLVLISGTGEKGFCAGGDLKELTQAVREGAVHLADRFFREEYDLDLLIHNASKPIVVLAHGITMGGGLGLAAGADIVVATETTRMAMPETRIGFFPDVGATGWLFTKCPPGYPEYLTLIGYELLGPECVRLGLATHLVPQAQLSKLRQALDNCAEKLPATRGAAAEALKQVLAPFALQDIPPKPEMDAWVREHLGGKNSLQEIIAALKPCRPESKLCEDAYQSLAERSPTALAVTLQLLRANAGRPLPEVFQREALAAHFLVTHPDYLEGIRARIIDKDNKPRWQPPTITELGPLAAGF
jgi:enoyl-CoA hydratase